MDENRFRSLMRGAIGDEAMSPWLADAVRTRVTTARPEVTSRRWIVLVAAALVAVLVAGIAGQRLLLQRQSSPIVPAATPSPHASPTPVDPFSCRLPVSAGSAVGFLNTRTGRYTADPSATSGAESYSPAAKRWLPVPARQISPDGMRYAWTDATNHLHVHSFASGKDADIWSHAGLFEVPVVWGRAGIYVVLNNLAPDSIWLVDPDTGSATRQIRKSNFLFTPLANDPHDTGFRPLGVDANGHWMWWFYYADRPGSPQSAFYETAPGQRVYIYQGTQGDAIGFNPEIFLDDSTGIWFSDHDGGAFIWHWAQQSGLRKVSVAGAPAGRTISPAGSCF